MDDTAQSLFSRLTWDDLSDWAGHRVVTTGNDLKRERAVQNLRTTPSGGIIGWVRDEDRLATLVEVASNALVSRCTCAAFSVCPHAVALILEYLERLKKSAHVPRVEDDDLRLLLVQSSPDGSDATAGMGDRSVGADTTADLPTTEPVELRTDGESLRRYLEAKSKSELEALLERAALLSPTVQEMLADQQELEIGDADRYVARIRALLDELSEPARFSTTPFVESFDWVALRRRLATLVESGHADLAVELGEQLVDAGTEAVEWYEQDGEIAYEVSECMTIIVTGLPASSLDAPAQVAWIGSIEARDEYGICSSALEPFWALERPREQWALLADEIARVLEDAHPLDGSSTVPRSYARDQLVDRLSVALERAGRTDQILRLFEREAIRSGNYEQLVRYLMEKELWEEAEQWCREGISSRGANDDSGTARFLRYALRTIYERTGSPERAAALRAEEFFVEPCVETFMSLMDAVEPMGLRSRIEASAMAYLESGVLPTDPRGEESDAWPLPDLGLPSDAIDRSSEAPLYPVLISVAIGVGHPDTVVEWLDRALDDEESSQYVPLDEVAEAIRERYPDRAIAIWRDRAEREIARGSAEGYRAAIPSLRSIRDTLRASNRFEEWDAYISSLRSRYRRKRRFLEIVDRLSDRPIVETL